MISWLAGLICDLIIPIFYTNDLRAFCSQANKMYPLQSCGIQSKNIGDLADVCVYGIAICL